MDISTSIDLQDALPLLRQALDERVRIVVVPAMCRESSRSMGGRIFSMDKGKIRLELDSLGGLAREVWLKQEATCYFQVTDKVRAREAYYNWTPKVVALNKKDNGWACDLTWPKELQLGQRRSSMRIVPDPELILGLSLWEEDRFSFFCEREQRRKLHPPLVTAVPGRDCQLTVEDICPGGIKLRIFAGVLQEGLQGWLKVSHRYLWLALQNPKTGDKTVLWLKARICHAGLDPAAGDLITGLEFTAHAVREEGGKQVWRPVEDRIMKELATWTHHCYQKQCFSGVR